MVVNRSDWSLIVVKGFLSYRLKTLLEFIEDSFDILGLVFRYFQRVVLLLFFFFFFNDGNNGLFASLGNR